MMKRVEILIKNSLLCVVLVILTSCSSAPKEQVIFITKTNFNFEDSLNAEKRINGDAHGGTFFSRADSSNIYGSNSFFYITDSLLQSTLRVKLDGWIRIGDLMKDKKYAFSLEDPHGNIIKWEQVDLRKHVTESNKWTHVVDSVIFPGQLVNSTGLLIKTYSFNPDGASTLDCDDVELLYYKIVKQE